MARHLTFASAVLNRYPGPPTGSVVPIALTTPQQNQARIESWITQDERRALIKGQAPPVRPIASIMDSVHNWKRTICQRVAALMCGPCALPSDQQRSSAMHAKIAQEVLSVAGSDAVAALVASDLMSTLMATKRATGGSADAQVYGAQLEQSAAWKVLDTVRDVKPAALVGTERPQFKSIGEHMVSRDRNHDGRPDKTHGGKPYGKYDRNHDGKVDRHQSHSPSRGGGHRFGDKGHGNSPSPSRGGRHNDNDDNDDDDDGYNFSKKGGRSIRSELTMTDGDEHLAALGFREYGASSSAAPIDAHYANTDEYGTVTLIVKNKRETSISVKLHDKEGFLLAEESAIRPQKSRTIHTSTRAARISVEGYTAGGRERANGATLFTPRRNGVYRLVVRRGPRIDVNAQDVTNSPMRFLREDITQSGDAPIGNEWIEVPIGSAMSAPAPAANDWVEVPIGAEQVGRRYETEEEKFRRKLREQEEARMAEYASRSAPPRSVGAPIGNEWVEVPVGAEQVGRRYETEEEKFRRKLREQEEARMAEYASRSAPPRSVGAPIGAAQSNKDDWVFVPYTKDSLAALSQTTGTSKPVQAEWTTTTHPIGGEQMIAGEKKKGHPGRKHSEDKTKNRHLAREDPDMLMQQDTQGAPLFPGFAPYKFMRDEIVASTPTKPVGAAMTAPATGLAQRPAHNYQLSSLVAEKRGLVRLDLPQKDATTTQITAISYDSQGRESERVVLRQGQYTPIAAGIHSLEIKRGNSSAAPTFLKNELVVSTGNEYALRRDGRNISSTVEQDHGAARLAQYAPALKPVANSVQIVHLQTKQVACAPIGSFMGATAKKDDYTLNADNGLSYSVHPSKTAVWDADLNEVAVHAMFRHPQDPSSMVMVMDHAQMPSAQN